MSSRNSSAVGLDELFQHVLDISPPPPPRQVSVEASVKRNDKTLSYGAMARHGRVIRGRIENRTEEIVPSSRLVLTPVQEENALTVTSLIGKRRDYRLKPYQRSPMLELFSIAASPRAVVGRAYVLGFYLSDEKGGRSNLAKINVKVVPQKRSGKLPWLLCAAAVVAAVTLTRRSRRSTEPREPRAAEEARVDDGNF